MNPITVTEYVKDLFIVDDGGVRCFLLIGTDHAVLIDTGMPGTGLAKKALELTDLPVKLYLTHGDIDHAGGLEDFDEVMVHDGDMDMISSDIKKTEIKEGDVITVGDFELEVVHIPGHTYGSVAFLDKKSGLFIIGDTVQRKGPIFMFGENRNLDIYISTLKKLQGMKGMFKEILPSHNEYPVFAEDLDHCLEDACALAAGELDDTARPCDFFPKPCDVYSGRNTMFLYVK